VRSNAPRLLIVVCFTLALALLVSACGGGGSSSTTTVSQTQKQQAKAKKKKHNLPVFPPGRRYFSEQSPWNTTIETLPEDSGSEEMLELARKRIGVVEQPGRKSRVVDRTIKRGFALNTRAWAPVIVEVDETSGVDTTLECRQIVCGAGIQVPHQLKLPADARPDPRYDGWMSLIDRKNGVGYDLWRARRQDNGVITFQFSKAWPLAGPGFSKPVSVAPARAVGARGSGLPLFAGVVEPNELKAGVIDHALAVSVPGLARRRYVQPASVTDGVGPVKALPAGARIRLKADVKAPEPKLNLERLKRLGRLNARNLRRKNLTGKLHVTETELRQARREEIEHRYVEAILATLHRYGAIVVDRAAVPTLYGQYGVLENLIEGNALEWLHLDDFEVVSLPTVRYDPPAGKSAKRASEVSRPATNGGF
jgi:hypothetical protein